MNISSLLVLPISLNYFWNFISWCWFMDPFADLISVNSSRKVILWTNVTVVRKSSLLCSLSLSPLHPHVWVILIIFCSPKLESRLPVNRLSQACRSKSLMHRIQPLIIFFSSADFLTLISYSSVGLKLGDLLPCYEIHHLYSRHVLHLLFYR